MKSCLNSTLRWGTLLLVLQSGYVLSQPIQLIPRKGGEEIERPHTHDAFSETQSFLEFWEGTPPSIVETYTPKLPLKLTSPILRSLRAHIGKEPFPDLLQKTTYETALLSLLTESGAWEQAKEFLLTANLPERESLLLNLEWLEGNQKKACEKVNNLIRTSSKTEWKQQNIYCLYINGEEERSKIALEVLTEANPTAAHPMGALFSEESQPPLEKFIEDSPFLLTVWLESKQSIPEDILNKLPSSTLAFIARSEKAPLATRLLAGEKALQQGTLKPEDFASFCQDAPTTDFWGEMATALTSAKPEALLSLFERAKKEQKLGLVGQVFTSSLSAIQLSPETLPLAPFMIRAFLQSNRQELAKKWGTFFMREAPDEAVSVRPLLHLAFPEENWDARQIQAWQAYENRMHAQSAPQHSYELRRVLIALGEPSGEPTRGEPSSPSWRQAKALFEGPELDLLESAAGGKRKGEVLLLGLTLIGTTPLRDISVDKLFPVLQALQKAGYPEESRALALEFLLAKGL